MQNSFSYERFRTWTRFETEAQENWEMAYCLTSFDAQLKTAVKQKNFSDNPIIKLIHIRIDIQPGAIIRDGDRKRAPFLVLGLAP